MSWPSSRPAGARTAFASDGRAAWTAALEKARDVAAGFELDGEARRELAHLLARAGSLRFPLPYASAADAAGGFVRLTRALLDAGLPEVRACLASAVVAAAACCLALLDHDDAAAAAAFQAAQARRLGEED